uniref:hypothetical protein RF2 n=1 Tax=Prosopanche bonacinae TaxID=2952648 RepID=UPI0021140543|nr:hypothetical protein RF2 [Prosopanche bonacinae]USN93696.1 hypothetical protein RF2 [Prosopanche bonacinae]
MINLRKKYNYNKLNFKQNFKKYRLNYKAENFNKHTTYSHKQKPFDFSKFSFWFYIESNDLITNYKKLFNLRIKNVLIFILNNRIKLVIVYIFFYSFLNVFNIFNKDFFFTIGNFNSLISLNKIILIHKKNSDSCKYTLSLSKKKLSKSKYYSNNIDIIGIKMSIKSLKEDFIFLNTLKTNDCSFYGYLNTFKNIYFNFYFIFDYEDNKVNSIYNVNIKNNKIKFKDKENNIFYLIKTKYYNKFLNTNIFYKVRIIIYLIKNTSIFHNHNIHKIFKFYFIIKKYYNKYYNKFVNPNIFYKVRIIIYLIKNTSILYINKIHKIFKLYLNITKYYNHRILYKKLKYKYTEFKREISEKLIKYKITMSIHVLSNNLNLLKIFKYLLNLASKRRFIYTILSFRVFKIYFISNLNSIIKKFILNLLNLVLLSLYHLYANIIFIFINITTKYNKNIVKLNLNKLLNYNYTELDFNIIFNNKEKNLFPYFKNNSLISLFLKTNSGFNKTKKIVFCTKKFPYNVNIKNKYNNLLYRYFYKILFTPNIKLNNFLKNELLKKLIQKEYDNFSNFINKDIFFNLDLSFKDTFILDKTVDLFKTSYTMDDPLINFDFSIDYCEEYTQINKKKIYKKYFNFCFKKIFRIITKYFKSYINYRKISISNHLGPNLRKNIENSYQSCIQFIYRFNLEFKKYFKDTLKFFIKIFFLNSNSHSKKIDYFVEEFPFIKMTKFLLKFYINDSSKPLLAFKSKFILNLIKKDNIIEIIRYDQFKFAKYILLFKLFFSYIFIFIILKYFKLNLKIINLLKIEYERNLVLMTKKYGIDLYVKLCKYGYLETCMKHKVSLYHNIFVTCKNEIFSIINEIKKSIIRFFIVDILFTLLEIDKVKTPYYYTKANFNLKRRYLNIKMKYKEYLHFYTESNFKKWYKFFIYDFYYLRTSISQKLFINFSKDITEEFYKRILKNQDQEDIYTSIVDQEAFDTTIMSNQSETQFEFESWINTNDLNFTEERPFLIQFINIFLNINKDKKLCNSFFKNISIKHSENLNCLENGYLYLIYFLDMLRIHAKSENIFNITEENRLFIANYKQISEFVFCKTNNYEIELRKRRKKPFSFSLTTIPSSSKGLLVVGQSEEVFFLQEKIRKDYADLPFIILNPIPKELSDYEIAKYSYDESDLPFVDKFDSTKIDIKKMLKKKFNKGTFEFENILNNLMPKRKTSIYDVFNIVTQFQLIDSISSCIICIPNIHLCHYSLKFQQFYELNNLISKFTKNNIILASTNKPQEIDPILIGYDKLSKCILLKKPTLEIKKIYIFNLLKTKGFYIENEELLHEHLNRTNLRYLSILTNQTLSFSLTQNKMLLDSQIIKNFIFYCFRFNQFTKKGQKVPMGIVFYQVGRFFVQMRLNSLIIDPMSVYLIDFKTQKYPLYKNYYELGTNIKKVTLIIYLLICSAGLISYKFFNTLESQNITHEYFNYDLNLITNLLNLERFFYFSSFRLINLIDNLKKNENEILKINKYNLIKSSIVDFSDRNAYIYETDILPTTNPSNKKFNLLFNILLDHFLTNKQQDSLVLKIDLEKPQIKKDSSIPYDKFMYVMYENYRFSDQLRAFVYNILKPLLDKNLMFNNKYDYDDSYKYNYQYKNPKTNLLLKMHYEATDYLKKLFEKNNQLINKIFKILIQKEFIFQDNFKNLILNINI